MPAVKIHHEVLDDLLMDPVFAAKALLGWDFDVFQGAALKLDWFFPWTVDSSGTGTGKTRRMFAMGHVVACYFPTWGGVGKQDFWPMFGERIRNGPPIFKDQFAIHRRKIHEEKGNSCWAMHLANRGRIEMPAPGFLTDSQSSAGRSFNTLQVDEWLKCAGNGLDQQLIERARRPAWNADHPVWCNHVHLKGHAQTPGHKGWSRYQTFLKGARDGDPMYMAYSFCYKDFTDDFKFVVNWKVVANQRRSLPKDEFSRQLLGLWQRSGQNYYPEAIVARAARLELVPEYARPRGCDDIYVCGVDVAPGQGLRSDYSAIWVRKLREVSLLELPSMAVKGGPKFVKVGMKVFEIRDVYAWSGQNLGAVEIAGIIHGLHMRFRFSRIVMDPNGGGLQVKTELAKTEATIGGSRVRVVPICTNMEMVTTDKQPILYMFKRGIPEFEALEFVGKEYCADDGGFLSAFHLRYAERWQRGEFNAPAPLQKRGARELREWNGDLQRIQRSIDEGFRQLVKVRQVTDAEGRLFLTRRGFPVFHSNTKKDIAYAGLYCNAAMELVFHEIEQRYSGRSSQRSF
jgi:hypothetical protein